MFFVRVHLFSIQIEVLWKPPPGPERYATCRPVDIFVLPPLPIQIVNITDIETVNIVRVSEELQDVIVSTRSASKYFSDPALGSFQGGAIEQILPPLPLRPISTCTYYATCNANNS